jgi:hypothetical protein
VQPDVVALSFKLKVTTLISGAASKFVRCAECCDGAKNLQARFGLKSFESFVFMECFDDTAMSMHGQTISSISSDALETDEIFVMNEAFLIRNHARVSCLSRHTRKEKTHIIRVNLIYHTLSFNSLMS